MKDLRRPLAQLLRVSVHLVLTMGAVIDARCLEPSAVSDDQDEGVVGDIVSARLNQTSNATP